MSDLREYAIAAYFRIFLPHISRLHGPHILKKNACVFLTCLINASVTGIMRRCGCGCWTCKMRLLMWTITLTLTLSLTNHNCNLTHNIYRYCPQYLSAFYQFNIRTSALHWRPHRYISDTPAQLTAQHTAHTGSDHHPWVYIGMLKWTRTRRQCGALQCNDSVHFVITQRNSRKFYMMMTNSLIKFVLLQWNCVS